MVSDAVEKAVSGIGSKFFGNFQCDYEKIIWMSTSFALNEVYQNHFDTKARQVN